MFPLYDTSKVHYFCLLISWLAESESDNFDLKLTIHILVNKNCGKYSRRMCTYRWLSAQILYVHFL